ncbi:hypothetical protein N8H71_25170 [Pseudomonas koreensis]|uniref:hypothetical protein n=1 Tax=Pseudomonas koreensis TaxID=198620 RepID=UPI0021C863D1|nr:hypothetical protein [Pseudomonas koreensis]MCU0074898.1 hypothetical protein [Pseudomonas koreensis]
MTSNFEIALSKHEFPDYFRGKGEYFTRDPDWGTQLHIRNWQDSSVFLKSLNNSTDVLKNAFSSYLSTVELTIADAHDLLENIDCYYYLRTKHPHLSKDGFDLIRDADNNEKQIVSATMSFLKKAVKTHNIPEELELFNRRIKILINSGGPDNITNL